MYDEADFKERFSRLVTSKQYGLSLWFPLSMQPFFHWFCPERSLRCLALENRRKQVLAR